MPHMCHLAESKPSSGFAAKRDASQTLYWAKASHPVSPQPPEPLAHDGIPGRPWCSKCTSVPKAPPSMLMQKPTEVISVRGPGTSGPIMDPLPGATASHAIFPRVSWAPPAGSPVPPPQVEGQAGPELVHTQGMKPRLSPRGRGGVGSTPAAHCAGDPDLGWASDDLRWRLSLKGAGMGTPIAASPGHPWVRTPARYAHSFHCASHGGK